MTSADLPDGNLMAQIIWRTKRLEHYQRQVFDLVAKMTVDVQWLRANLESLPEAHTQVGREKLADMDRAIAQMQAIVASSGAQAGHSQDAPAQPPYRPSDHVVADGEGSDL